MSHRSIARWAGLAAFAVSTIGLGVAACSSGKTICDKRCECLTCSDRTFDECVINVNEDVARADAYGCSEQMDLANDCYLQRFGCDTINNVIAHPDAEDCAKEQQRLQECIAAASKLL